MHVYMHTRVYTVYMAVILECTLYTSVHMLYTSVTALYMTALLECIICCIYTQISQLGTPQIRKLPPTGLVLQILPDFACKIVSGQSDSCQMTPTNWKLAASYVFLATEQCLHVSTK